MKCQFYFLSCVDAILVVCRCIQRNVSMVTYMSKCFMKPLWQKETQAHFLRNNSLTIYKFLLTNLHFLGGSGFNILNLRIFRRKYNRFISLVLKAKQQKVIQLPYILSECYINKFSNQFLFFLHSPALLSLELFMWRVISILFHVTLYLT